LSCEAAAAVTATLLALASAQAQSSQPLTMPGTSPLIESHKVRLELLSAKPHVARQEHLAQGKLQCWRSESPGRSGRRVTACLRQKGGGSNEGLPKSLLGFFEEAGGKALGKRAKKQDWVRYLAKLFYIEENGLFLVL